MVIVSAVVFALAVFNPPSIFWIMFLGGAVAASAWMPVAVASIFSKRVTKAGAFCGMLFGTLGCFGLKLYTSLMGIALPVYLDPSIVGIVCNVAAMVIVSALTRVTEEEKAAREELFVVPDSEKKTKGDKENIYLDEMLTGIGGCGCFDSSDLVGIPLPEICNGLTATSGVSLQGEACFKSCIFAERNLEEILKKC